MPPEHAYGHKYKSGSKTLVEAFTGQAKANQNLDKRRYHLADKIHFLYSLEGTLPSFQQRQRELENAAAQKVLEKVTATSTAPSSKSRPRFNREIDSLTTLSEWVRFNICCMPRRREVYLARFNLRPLANWKLLAYCAAACLVYILCNLNYSALFGYSQPTLYEEFYRNRGL